jgi:hypothetical protein
VSFTKTSSSFSALLITNPLVRSFVRLLFRYVKSLVLASLAHLSTPTLATLQTVCCLIILFYSTSRCISRTSSVRPWSDLFAPEARLHDNNLFRDPTANCLILAISGSFLGITIVILSSQKVSMSLLPGTHFLRRSSHRAVSNKFGTLMSHFAVSHAGAILRI